MDIPIQFTDEASKCAAPPAGWIIVMVSSLAFQRRLLDSCSSSRTLLPGFWLEPENLSISHQSSGPCTGFQLHLGLILKYIYSFINHSIGLRPKYMADMLTEYKPNMTTQIIRIESVRNTKGSHKTSEVHF